MGFLCVLGGAFRFSTEEATLWFLHAVHPRFSGFGSSPTDEEVDNQCRKDHNSWWKVGGVT